MVKYETMNKNVLLCVDNSADSTAATRLAVEYCAKNNVALTALHVYAAELHNDRFRALESTLPEKYQNEAELTRQRDIHSGLITRGLEIISDSYMSAPAALAAEKGVSFTPKKREGKNFDEILKEAVGHSLLILGSTGLGRSSKNNLGSVTERVSRLGKIDTFMVRADANPSGAIVAAIDGSLCSFAALKSAIDFSKSFNLPLKAIAAFDPHYHVTAFRSIAGVLSEESSKIFKFKEQEKLHNEIIDKNLAALYQKHLDTASTFAAQNNAKIETKLLSGKPFEAILEYASIEKPFMICMGRIGLHATPSLDIGSATENVLRLSNANVFITSKKETVSTAPEKHFVWSSEADATLQRIPVFVRGMVKKMAEDEAEKLGKMKITEEMLIALREKMKP